MPQPVVFTPKPPNLYAFWAIVSVVIGVFLLMSLHTKGGIPGALIVGALCILVLLPFKLDVQVTIDIENKTLKYDYVRGWGKHGSTIIDLATAAGNYRLIPTRTSKYWRIKLYNGNRFFGKKVSITDSGGFTKAQLDEIETPIDQCRGIEKSYAHHGRR